MSDEVKNAIAKQAETGAATECAFKDLAFEVIRGTVSLGTKYLDLCQYMRDHSIPKETATQWLLDLNFAKSRASEICRVASASEKLWDEYKARSLGWHKVLSLTRAEADAVLADGSLPLLSDGCECGDAELDLDEKAVVAEEAAQTPEAALERSKKLAWQLWIASSVCGRERLRFVFEATPDRVGATVTVRY